MDFPDAAPKDIRKGEDEASPLQTEEGFSCQRIGQNEILKNDFARFAETNSVHCNACPGHGFFQSPLRDGGGVL